MSELAPLISDLALILILAGIFTLLFKKLKQPLVLGYIVAGFLASPHFTFTPSVIDTANIHTWSDIGVIFLLFALGLEFSFKKLLKVGGSVVISACTIIFCMIMVGIFVGSLCGWKQMDCIYLGGMLAMSSTTIIYKAYDDMGLRQQRFAGIVLSILILEDILAIVLMVMLSTVAVSTNFEGGEMVYSMLKLVFFLILWFVVGLYLIPLFLRKVRGLMSNETLLIVALALCFGMVVLAAQAGFSPSFGAFIMGSIISETVESELIEKIVGPVKDLFGAIFFVSVGMMVDPNMIVEYIGPILAIVAAIIIGQTIFSTCGVLLSGERLKTAMQCSFSLTQIGEFAFIIASLGVSLGVTSDFLYPIVVAVSVITTFITPYMIRLALPAYNALEKVIPQGIMDMLERYASRSAPVNNSSNWKKLMTSIIKNVVIYAVLTVAIITICINFIAPLMENIVDPWGRLLATVITLAAIAPFVRALIVKRLKCQEFKTLWSDNRINHAPLIAVSLLRVVIGLAFVAYVIHSFFPSITAILVFIISIVVVAVILYSRAFRLQSIRLEQTFEENLRSKEMHQEYHGEKRPEYAGRLLDRDMHLTDFLIPADSLWAGKTLKDLDLGKKYSVHVASIIRGSHRINIPGGDNRIFPGDTLQVIGTDQQLKSFAEQAQKVAEGHVDMDYSRHEMVLKQFMVGENSCFAGKTIIEAGLRNVYHCLVVGVESADDGILRSPNIHTPMVAGEVIWIVGEQENLKKLNEELKVKSEK